MEAPPITVSRGSIDAVVCDNATIKIYDNNVEDDSATATMKATHLATIDDLNDAATDLSISAERNHLVAALGNGTLAVFSLTSLEQLADLHATNGNGIEIGSQILSVASSPRDPYLCVSGGQDNSVRFWSTKTLRSTVDTSMTSSSLSDSFNLEDDDRDHKQHNSNNSSSSKQQPASPTVADEKARREAEERALYQRLVGHESHVMRVVFSPHGVWVASCSKDKTVRVWNAETHEKVAVLHGHTNAVLSVAFCPVNDGVLASGGADGTIRIWDWRRAVCIGDPLKLASGSINSIVFSPDGKRLVVGCDDMTVRLIDVNARTQIGAPMKGHAWPVLSVDFSPDGKIAASASGDWTVRLWDTATQKQIGPPLSEHTDAVRCVLFADNRTLISCGEDKSICIFTLDRKGKELMKHQLDLGSATEITGMSLSLDGSQLAVATSSKSNPRAVTVLPMPVGAAPPIYPHLIAAMRAPPATSSPANSAVVAANNNTNNSNIINNNSAASSNLSNESNILVRDALRAVAASSVSPAANNHNNNNNSNAAVVAASAPGAANAAHAAAQGNLRHVPLSQPDLLAGTFNLNDPDQLAEVKSMFPPNFVYPSAEIQIIGDIASGGMGSVHKAAMKSVEGWYVAVKRFRDREAQKTAVREIIKGIQFRHRNIVQCHGLSFMKTAFGTELVMLQELADDSLEGVLKKKGVVPRDWRWCTRVAKQLAEGLAYLHSRTVPTLHLDIKPSNVLVWYAGGDTDLPSVVKLADFGLAHTLSAAAHDETNVSKIGGTRRYASKEQLSSNTVSPRCDTYSFGALIFELVVGHGPWERSTEDEIRNGDLIDTLVPRSGCPDRLLEVCRRCLSPKPEGRPVDGIELVEMLLEPGDELPAFLRPDYNNNSMSTAPPGWADGPPSNAASEVIVGVRSLTTLSSYL